MGFQPLSPPCFLLPSTFSLSPGRSLSLSSFSPFFKQELAWSQHHLEICMGKAAAAPPPGGVPGARGKVWGGGRGGRETWSCKDCRSASRGFPPRRPCPISMAAAPTPVHPHPQVCLAVLQPERLSFLIRGHGHLHHFQYLN